MEFILFTLLCCCLFYNLQEENGKSFFSDKILKFKGHHAVFTTPKCIRKLLALPSGLGFRISVLQINTTQETKWQKKPNQV